MITIVTCLLKIDINNTKLKIKTNLKIKKVQSHKIYNNSKMKSKGKGKPSKFKEEGNFNTDND